MFKWFHCPYSLWKVANFCAVISTLIDQDDQTPGQDCLQTPRRELEVVLMLHIPDIDYIHKFDKCNNLARKVHKTAYCRKL